MIRTAYYSPLASAISHICRNWTFHNQPYKAAEARAEKALLSLQEKQAYLQSLDSPASPK